MFGFKRKERDRNGRFAKGNRCAGQTDIRRTRKADTKQVVSPVDIMRFKLDNLKPIFFEHPMIPGRIQKGLCLGDGHYLNPKIQNRAQKMIPLQPLLNYIEDNAPWDFILLAGDMLDVDYLSHWNSKKFKDIGHQRIEEYLIQETNDMYELLKEIKRVSKAKCIYYMEGNHEGWIQSYQDEHQKLGKKSLDQWLRLDELGITFIPQYGVLKLGPHAAARHGECYGTENPAKQAIMKSHRSYFMWHWHKLIAWPGYSDVDETEKLQAYCVPGLCNVCTAEFMKNRPNNWSCGFLELYIKPSGKFTPHIIPMAPNGHFIIHGKEYT